VQFRGKGRVGSTGVGQVALIIKACRPPAATANRPSQSNCRSKLGLRRMYDEPRGQFGLALDL
jgi:hypothetical protein